MSLLMPCMIGIDMILDCDLVDRLAKADHLNHLDHLERLARRV